MIITVTQYAGWVRVALLIAWAVILVCCVALIAICASILRLLRDWRK